MRWTVEFLNPTVVAEYLSQPKDIQARFERTVLLVAARGIDQLHEPHAKHLQGPLWELRLQGKDGIARAIYVTRSGRRVVVVRVFTKKRRRRPVLKSNLRYGALGMPDDEEIHSG